MKNKLRLLLGLSGTEPLPDAKKKKIQWETLTQKVKFSAILIVVIFEVFFFYYLAKTYGMIGDSVTSGDKIAVIDFNNEVTQEYVNTIINQMDDIREDDGYLEVLFIMNSPGGSPTASEELSEYLRDYTGDKNVTMYIQSSAASGGYYIASAVKPLYTNKNAIVGSIGVIMPHYNIGKLAETIGIEEDDLSAGEFKKPVSFFKKMNEKEKTYLKKHLLTPIYDNFIAAVAENRGLSVDELSPYAEGKIYTGNDKKILGVLVDKVTVLHKLKEKIKKQYEQEVAFVSVATRKGNILFGDKIKFDISLDTNFGPSLK